MGWSSLLHLLERHGVNNLKALYAEQSGEHEQPKPKTFKDYEPGYLHVDIKYLPQMPDDSQKRHLVVAINRATRWVDMKVLNDKGAENTTLFIKRLQTRCPVKIRTILTDNGKEFTDRFTANGEREPTGKHAFDKVCSANSIEHRLIKPKHPQTNGMVERFNGRIAHLLKTTCFSHADEMIDTLEKYQKIYNHHLIQRNLGHITPVQALKTWYKEKPDLFNKRIYEQAGLVNGYDLFNKRVSTVSNTIFKRIHEMHNNRHILGMRIDATSYSEAKKLIINWAKAHKSKYVCISTVHMVMEGYDNLEYQKIVNSADLVTPDGVPLVWMLRALGIKNQQRVYGPDLTLHVCSIAEKHGIPIGFYGGMPESLNDLVSNIQKKYPNLKIVYKYSPPFRQLTQEEDKSVINEIENSGTRILFVGLGCPKQERWASEHKDKLNSVMIAVGAAFDFHSGRVRQAPSLVQNIGMEWLFRLIMEPKRLWKRHLKNNPRFIFLSIQQIIRHKLNIS